MSLVSFYPQIKAAHITMVAASGSLFFIRGTAALLGAAWPKGFAAKITSYSIDTLLLTSALMLFSMFPAAYFSNGWLVTKIVLLTLYIVVGYFALQNSTVYPIRVVLFTVALLLFFAIVLTAIQHHPMGSIQSLMWLVTPS